MKKAAEKTADIDMSKFQRRPAGVIDGQSPSSLGTQKSEPKRFTGVGSVMHALTREAEVSGELAGTQAELRKATERLAEFEGTSIERALNPTLVGRSRWANRDPAEFATQEFLNLKDEIANAGRNVQAIKVRALEPPKGVLAGQVIDGQSPEVRYEIVYGHRRHQACLELGVPVYAIVVEVMSDQDLFAAMDRENRHRKNLSAWEQGRMYEQAIRQGLYPSIRNLAEKLGVNQSDASRAVQLAKLPKEVVEAFKSPLELQVRWAKPLTDALQRDPEGVLSRARTLKNSAGSRPPADVLNRLLGVEDAAVAPPDVFVVSAGKQIATVRSDGRGRVSVQFEPGAVSDDRRKDLARLIEAFLNKQASDAS